MNIGKRIAIFDTSVIDGEKNTDRFFGGRQELEKFSTVCEIIIPDMVIDEISKHKKKYLRTTKSQFLSNPFRFILGLEHETINNLNVDEIVQNLIVSETISHKAIGLTKVDALERIKVMCHADIAPFGESGDKGFKDAYILLTIEEYLETVIDEQIFVVIKDGKLKEALSILADITIVKDFDEFELFNKSQFNEKYFLQRLSETIGEQVEAEGVLSADFNINDNWVLRVNTAEKPTCVEVDFKSKDIISFAKVRLTIGINNLVTSGNFDTTDKWVGKMSDHVQYFTSEQMIELINGAVSNDQIYWIATKESLKQFFYPIFEKVKDLLDEVVAKRFREKFYEIN